MDQHIFILGTVAPLNQTSADRQLRRSSCVNVMFVSSGEPHAVCPNPTIKAAEGDAVALLCHLDPPSSVVNYAVDWKRVDLNKVVYSYRHKHENRDDQMDQYRGRTTLSPEDLSRGNLSLWISSVQTADSGPYRCYVSKLRTSCNTWLIVGKHPDFNTVLFRG